jgi:hypothetical protein
MKRFATAAWIFVFAALAAPIFTQSILPRLAVAEFSLNTQDPQAAQDAITVRNQVESQLVYRLPFASRNYRIIGHEEIDAILNRERIQVSGIASPENIRKLKANHIGYLITGSVDAIGRDYVVTLKIFDVSLGQFFHSANYFIGGPSRDLRGGVNILVAKFFSGMAGSGEKEYQPGDPGPAGGIVFYDKGFFSGGWRYLEAAPVETEFTAQWGAHNRDAGTTGQSVGTGRQNTQIIMNFLRQQGESGKAAQQCVVMFFGGVVDWFLPGKDELDAMYKNLKAQGLGGFSNSVYWSSSQIDLNYAWSQDFSGGRQSHDFKNTRCYVRAIRAF